MPDIVVRETSITLLFRNGTFVIGRIFSFDSKLVSAFNSVRQELRVSNSPGTPPTSTLATSRGGTQLNKREFTTRLMTRLADLKRNPHQLCPLTVILKWSVGVQGVEVEPGRHRVRNAAGGDVADELAGGDINGAGDREDNL